MSKLLLFMLLVGLAWISATRPPEQMFPENVDYCCHCPNIKMKCTFSEKPFAASWTAFDYDRGPNQVTDSTPGHFVDTSEMKCGTLYLHVNNTKHSAGNSYSCTAVYADGTAEVSEVFLIPMLEDVTAPIRNLVIEPMQDALQVQWDHDYYLCRNFTIYLNGTAVLECTNITALDCTIRNLEAGVMFEVKVVATESDIEPIEASEMIATLEPILVQNAGIRCEAIGNCIWLALILIVAMWNE